MLPHLREHARHEAMLPKMGQAHARCRGTPLQPSGPLLCGKGLPWRLAPPGVARSDQRETCRLPARRPGQSRRRTPVAGL